MGLVVKGCQLTIASCFLAFLLSCFLAFTVSLFDPRGVSSSRPAWPCGRRAQGPSRLAVAVEIPQTIRSPGHALTAPSTAPGCHGSGRRCRAKLGDVRTPSNAVDPRGARSRGHLAPQPCIRWTTASRDPNNPRCSHAHRRRAPWRRVHSTGRHKGQGGHRLTATSDQLSAFNRQAPGCRRTL